MDVSIPRVPEAQEDTYAYSLPEIKSMLAVLPEPARTIVLTSAFTGLRKSELRGLHWNNFNGEQLNVERSVWNSTESEPKTKRSRSPIPVMRPLAEALDSHRLRAGLLAQPSLPIFQAGNGKPLNLDNLVRRVIVPALSVCAICKKREDQHDTEAHTFARDKNLPLWHGWHAFRRGLATNLHSMGVADKDIQAILRHSTIGLTQNVYIKSINKSQVNALDALTEKFETCNDLATDALRTIQ
jgi:integrase